MTIDIYSSYQHHWERRATVRSRPRRLLIKNEGHFFPLSRQPLCCHQLVKLLGDSAIAFILIQSAYKFMWDIALIETKIVNEVAEKIANDGFSIHFPSPLKCDALTVLVDESYHAYVARDFMAQLESLTNIPPIDAVAEPTGLYIALQQCFERLSPKHRELFQLVAISIAENSITSDLVALNKDGDDDINSVFYQVNQDHMVDEARHSKIFEAILRYTWSVMSVEERMSIANELPRFLREYLDIRYQRAFNRAILEDLGLQQEDIEQVINDTHIEYTDNFQMVNPIVSNVIQFFTRAGIFESEAIREIFINSGLELN